MVIGITWFIKGFIALIMFITYEKAKMGSEKLFVVSPSVAILVALGPISLYLVVLTMIADAYVGG